MDSISLEKPINITFNDNPSRPTKFERERNIECFGLRQITDAVEPFAFNMSVGSISDVEPDNLRKVIIYHFLS